MKKIIRTALCTLAAMMITAGSVSAGVLKMDVDEMGNVGRVELTSPDYAYIGNTPVAKATSLVYTKNCFISHVWDPETKTLHFYFTYYDGAKAHLSIHTGSSYMDYSEGYDDFGYYRLVDSRTYTCSVPNTIINGSLYVDANALAEVCYRNWYTSGSALVFTSRG